MHRFKKIGLVIDLKHSNADVLSQAKELMQANHASISVLCASSDEIKPEYQATIEKNLRSSAGFDFSLYFLVGKPIIEITRFVIEQRLDMLLIEPDKEDHLLNQFFQGALALSLLRKAPCPVWIVKRPLSSSYQRVAIAIDPVDHEDEAIGKALTDKLIQIGTSYAKAQSAECFLVTAWHLQEEGMLNGPFIDISAQELEKLNVEEHQRYALAFEALQKKHDDILQGCHRIMLHGEPAHAIAKFITEHNIDLVIMGTLARAGIQGFLIGNTAESVIHMTHCSILTVKPDDFVSPITL